MDPTGKHRASLAICMIVKNEQDNLNKTLPNNVKFSDRTILVDTGSDDNTAEAAKGLGAEVYQFAWNNDFADARNFSISKAKEDWILWLDADEYVDERSFGKIRDFLDGTKADVVYLPIYECRYGETEGDTYYLRDKLFRNNMGAHFIKPVNEQVVFPEHLKITGENFLEAKISHWGNGLEQEAMDKKIMARIGLLKKTAAEYPEDFGVRYLLGMKCSEVNLINEAMDHYAQVISICEKDAAGSSLKRCYAHAARANRAKILLKNNRTEESLTEALAAIELAPWFLEPCDCAVMALLKLEKYEDALVLTTQMLKLPKAYHPVLLFNDEKWNSLAYVLHMRALLKAKGKKAALDFAEGVLEEKPENAAVKQAVEILQKMR